MPDGGDISSTQIMLYIITGLFGFVELLGIKILNDLKAVDRDLRNTDRELFDLARKNSDEINIVKGEVCRMQGTCEERHRGK